jgi:hypothetical protein
MRQLLSSSFGGAAAASSQTEAASFVLVFRSLFQSGQAFAFACDPQGRVDMDGMSERARNNYLYARAMIGRELHYPSVHTSDSVSNGGVSRHSASTPVPPRMPETCFAQDGWTPTRPDSGVSGFSLRLR